MYCPLFRAAFVLALTLATPVFAEHANPRPATEKQQADFNRIDQSLGALADALARIGEEKGRTPFANAMNDTASQHRQRARQLIGSGHPDAAREELERGMIAVKTAIATLRNRETLIRSLDFSNPADEYNYELDRFHTYGMLVNLLLDKMKPDPAKRAAMEQLMEQAWKEETIARQHAEAGNYKAAISQQEQSNKLLLQAIRRGGIYVPG